MEILQILLCTTLAYLIGSIPAGIWLGKLRYGIDIREHGSGTATHTNIQRVLGARASYLSRILDVGKGLLAGSLAFFLHNRYGIFTDLEYPILSLNLGLAAILGHILPVFAGFRGGKGFHVTLGVLLAIHPFITLVFGGSALLIFLISRYPQLGYVAGGLAVPIYVLLSPRIFGDMVLPMTVFGFLLFLTLLISHRDSLQRMLKGTTFPNSGGLF